MTAEAQLYSALVRIAAEKGIELDLNADLHIPGRNINLDIPMQLLTASTDRLPVTEQKFDELTEAEMADMFKQMWADIQALEAEMFKSFLRKLQTGQVRISETLAQVQVHRLTEGQANFCGEGLK